MAMLHQPKALQLLAALALLCHAPAKATAAQRPPVLAGEVAAVAALLQRKLPGSNQFLLKISPDACGAATCFRLADAPGGRTSVTGTSASELSAGVGHYLREHCNMTMGWRRGGGSRFSAPSPGGWPVFLAIVCFRCTWVLMSPCGMIR